MTGDELLAVAEPIKVIEKPQALLLLVRESFGTDVQVDNDVIRKALDGIGLGDVSFAVIIGLDVVGISLDEVRSLEARAMANGGTVR